MEDDGFLDVQIIGSPADIKATKNGETYFFEIKMTKQSEKYFGAATLTEFAQALKTPDHFKFVIAKTNDDEDEFEFFEYSPLEFMDHCVIPPFKIYFNIELVHNAKSKNKKTAVPLTMETMKFLTELHDKLRT